MTDTELDLVLSAGHGEYWPTFPDNMITVIWDPPDYEDLLAEADDDAKILDAFEQVSGVNRDRLPVDTDLQWERIVRIKCDPVSLALALGLLVTDLTTLITTDGYPITTPSGDDDTFDYWPSGVRLALDMAEAIDLRDEAAARIRAHAVATIDEGWREEVLDKCGLNDGPAQKQARAPELVCAIPHDEMTEAELEWRMKLYIADMRRSIDETGSHMLQGVMAGDDSQAWVYTVGLSEHGWPELAMTGLDPRDGGRILNDIVEHLQATDAKPAVGEMVDFYGTGFPFVLRACVSDDAAYPLSMARELYGPVAALQVVICDDQHRYPWDEGDFPFKRLQPLIPAP